MNEIGRAINHFTMLRRLDSGEKKGLYDIAISALEKQLNNGWIPVSEELPEEHRCSDEDDCYRMSENVLCSAYNEDINEYETWIDYTIDGEWQAHEYYEGEKLAWQPLPTPYRTEVAK